MKQPQVLIEEELFHVIEIKWTAFGELYNIIIVDRESSTKSIMWPTNKINVFIDKINNITGELIL